jgi:hypothetical protein
MNKAAEGRNLLRTMSILLAREQLTHGLARKIREDIKTCYDAHGGITYEGLSELIDSKKSLPMAFCLLLMACTAPRDLRDLAEALCNGTDVASVTPPRPIALELVNAYEQCTAFHPTLPEVRETFIARKKCRWPGDFYARRALRSLGLVLRAATRGRPTGPRRTNKLAH